MDRKLKGRPHFLKKTLRRSSLAALFVVVGIGAYVGYLQLSGNFNAVIAGEVYRSAQPSGAVLAEDAKQYGIKSIINLRGENSGVPWYEEEITAAKKLGIRHYDFGMSAGTILPKDRAEQLISLMARAEKPLLIHCQAGADRSGLASALYLAAIAKAGEKKAESQISLRFGHFSVPYLSHAYPMDVSFELLEPWLGFSKQ